ncbi:MAG: hypothetical protein KDD06_03475 [Phaeodactylibacter sp.]|nr:hypothetical protein [Phaeodactylibacter sp.]MCB9289635.1 hypothetical protein [Lewinellaceae bacterium]
MQLPPLRTVIFTPPTGRPCGKWMIRNTNVKFLADQYKDEDNILQRWGVMLKAINQAGSFIKKMYSDEKSLKLFLGPEWFFRKKNVMETDAQLAADPKIPLNYVPPFTQKEVISLIEKLLKDSQIEAYRSWLIVPGTIYWGKKGKQGRWDTYNVAVAINNGKLHSLVHKQGNADVWADHENWGTGDDLKKAIAESKNLIQELKKRNIINKNEIVDTQGFFTCQNIRFGMDICQDHDPTIRLMKETINATPRLNGRIEGRFPYCNVTDENGLDLALRQSFVDVHLLVSNGQAVNPNGVIARKGGIVVQADGSVSGIDSWNLKTDKFYGKPLAERMDSARVYRIVNSWKGTSPNWKIEANLIRLDDSDNRIIQPKPSADVYQRFIVFDDPLNLNTASVAVSSAATLK